MLDNKEIRLNQLNGIDKDRLKTVHIYLKRGNMIPIHCRDFILKTIDNTITGYECYGLEGGYPLYIDSREIAAVIYVND